MYITIHAPAKINLNLHILGRRSDGFHELHTILQSIELHDTLSISERRGPLTIRSRAPSVPRDRSNLVWKAACGLWRVLGRRGLPAGVTVSIRKAIPLEAGLGGGSSDAVAALRGLSVLWQARLDPALLRDLTAGIGSDAPFFLDGGTALGTGRGERVRPLPDLERHWIVLAVPWFGVSTAHAYRWWDMTGSRARRRGTRFTPLGRRWATRLRSFSNDLELPVAGRHPEVRIMTDRFRASGAVLAGMTGSGSAVFGLFARDTQALAARRAARRTGWRTTLTRTVASREFARLTHVTPARPT